MGAYIVEQIYDSMKLRCGNQHFPSYADCSICEEWLNDKNSFYQWAFQNLYNCEIDILELDKDLFSTGEKLYSPETCCFLPKRINSALVVKKKSYSIYPTGITITGRGKYASSVSCGSKKVRKVFDSMDEACKFYVSTKERFIRELADYYKQFLPDRIYTALLEYKVEQYSPYKR